MIGVEIKTVEGSDKKPDMVVAEKALEVLKSAGFSDEVIKEVKDLLAEECSETPEDEKKEGSAEADMASKEKPAEKANPMLDALARFKEALTK
jgi:DNA mismatch repair ATPase MutS